MSLQGRVQGADSHGPLAPSSAGGENGLGTLARASARVGGGGWAGSLIAATATAIPLNLLFASTLSGLLHALREALLTAHRSLLDLPPASLSSCLCDTTPRACPAAAASSCPARPACPPIRQLVCAWPCNRRPFCTALADLQPSLRAASICDTSPAQRISRTTAPPPPPSLCPPSSLRCSVAPVHDGVTAPPYRAAFY